MPIKKAAKKAQRVTKRRSKLNTAIKEKVRASIVAVRKNLAAKKIDEAKKSLKQAASQLDRAVKKGVYHRRTAARLKSRLSAAIKRLTKGRA